LDRPKGRERSGTTPHGTDPAQLAGAPGGTPFQGSVVRPSELADPPSTFLCHVSGRRGAKDELSDLPRRGRSGTACPVRSSPHHPAPGALSPSIEQRERNS